MVAYTRQSTITDGDTITAALFNNEYNQLLSAFSYASSGTTGHKHDGTAGEGGHVPQIGDQDFLNKIVTDSTNNRFGIFVQVSSSAVEQIRIQDGAIVPVTDNDIDLGTSSVEFKDAYFDGTVTTDALVADTADINGGTVDGATIGASSATTIVGTTITANTAFVPDASDGAALGTSSLEFSDLFLADAAVINFGDDQDVTLTHVADTGLLLNSTMQLQFNDSSQYINAPSATVLDINATDEIELNATLVDVNANLDISGTYTGAGLMTTGGNIVIPNDGNIGSVGDTDAIAISSGGVVTFSQNVTVTGDLTISGDDLTMGTNTSGMLLIADGTNFNPTAVTSLSEISTVANDDVFLAIDTSGGGLKKIARSAVVSGLATSSAISNVVEDTSPQLGGNLDTNSQNILIDDAHFIADENGNEQIIFQTTSSAVNQIDVTNAATGNAPEIAATGGDTNVSLKLTPKGSGQVLIDGNVGIETGLIDLKNGGSQSAVRLYCESSNAHYAAIQAPAHSAFSGNVTLTLPASTDTLAGIAATQTLTNKTLTTPVIAEIDSGSTITLDATTDIVLDADGGDIFFKDAGTTFGSATNTSGNLIIKSGTTTALTFSGANVTGAGTYTGGGTMTTGGNIVIPDAGNIGSASDTDAIAIGSDGDVTLTQDLELQHDGAILSFGANDEITLTHVHDTGLLLEDSGGTPTLQFHDSNEAVSSDGSNLKLTSGGTTFTIPSSDGSSGQALGTNGSGVLSFVNVASAADDLTTGDAAVTLATSAGNITIDAQGNDTDIILKGTDGSSDTTFLTIDGSDAGTASFNHDVKLANDAAVLGFGADNDVTLTHVADTGLLLNSTMQLQFNDASQNINAPSATVLDINATDEIELNATLADVNANLDVSGTYTGGGTMTTGGNIVIPDAGNIGSASDTDAMAIASTGQVTFTQQPKVPFAQRSFIRNGDMAIAQRSTQSIAASGYAYGACDGWKIWMGSAAAVDASQDAESPDGFNNSLKLDITTQDASLAAGDAAMISQLFEGFDMQSLNKGDAQAKTLTISFWVRSPVTGIHILECYDYDNNRFVSKSYTVASADTWEYHSCTFPADTSGALDDDNARSFNINFWLLAGSNYTGGGSLNTSWGTTTNNRAVGQVNVLADDSDNFYLTGVQMELGEVATEFQYESFKENLSRCQRYFMAYGPSGTDATDDYVVIGTGLAAGTTFSWIEVNPPTPMRTRPSATFNNVYIFDGNNRFLGSITYFSGEDGAVYRSFSTIWIRAVNVGSSTDTTVGRASQLYTNAATDSYFWLSADL